ncbi:hypothetical protein [Tropicimonas sp.]|uniref:hypothetical protein n=1 Tax=Tropicimonas sp. TaxID=2067044 RepID=UPI003A8B7632
MAIWLRDGCFLGVCGRISDLVCLSEPLPKAPPYFQVVVPCVSREPVQVSFDMLGPKIDHPAMPVPDLDGQPLHEITTVSQFGSRKTIQYRPRTTGFSADAEYRLRQHRETPIMPGCTALFTVGFNGGAKLSTISFSLTDFDLIRQHVAEVDRQILEALTTDAPVAPADMDL